MMVNLKKHTSNIGDAGTRREKVATIEEVNTVNRMFAILTSFIHSCQLLFFFKSRINHIFIEDQIGHRENCVPSAATSEHTGRLHESCEQKETICCHMRVIMTYRLG